MTINTDQNVIALRPALQIEVARDAAQVAHFEANRRPGVRFGGMDIERPTLRSPRDLIAAAEASEARATAFRAGPRGRFYSAVVNIGQAGGYVAEAHRALAAYSRGFSNPARPVDTAEIGAALDALNEVVGRDAQVARAALAELLMQREQEAA